MLLGDKLTLVYIDGEIVWRQEGLEGLQQVNMQIAMW
jgi:hypothetical protein